MSNESFNSEWFIVTAPSGGQLSSTLDLIVESAIKSVMSNAMVVHRPKHYVGGKVTVVVGMNMISTYDRGLLAKGIVEQLVSRLPKSCSISAVHLTDTGDAPGVPETDSSIRTTSYKGRDSLGRSLDETPSDIGPDCIESLLGATPQGRVVIDYKTEGRL